MSFDGKSENIYKLFGIDGLFSIPHYQRDYSWDESNIEKFCADIEDSYTNNESMYFIGSIICIKKDNNYEIIDGQQRITTIFIYLKIMKELIKEHNKDSRSISAIDNLLYNLSTNELKLRLETRNIIKKLPSGISKFSDFIDTSHDKLDKIQERSNKYLRNYDKIFKILNTLDKVKLEELCAFVLYKINVIKIECDNLANAIKIFDTINSTGVDLTNSDIIKARIMSKYNTEDFERIDNTWIEIEEISKEVATGRGNAMDIMINNFFFYKNSNYELKTIEKFDKFGIDINDLYKFAQSCKEICKAKCPWIDLLKNIKWDNAWLPFLVKIYINDKQAFSKSKKIIVKLCYSYYLAGRRADAILPDIKSLIGDNEIKISENHIKEIDNMLSLIDLYTDTSYKKRIKAVFCLLETFHNDSTFLLKDSELSIDHLFPKSKSNNNSLGNLILMEKAKNSEFGAKVAISDKHNSYQTSPLRYCANSFDSNFTEYSIEDRTAKIKKDINSFFNSLI